MTKCYVPNPVPLGWHLGCFGDGVIISKRFNDGLGCVFSWEEFDGTESDCPPMGPGKYAHISLSRDGHYPSWDEMRDFIYDPMNDDWIDRKRDMVMFLPPKNQYVNQHEFTFHFYQKSGAVAEKNILG